MCSGMGAGLLLYQAELCAALFALDAGEYAAAAAPHRQPPLRSARARAADCQIGVRCQRPAGGLPIRSADAAGRRGTGSG